jgi:hypothetical protein
MDKHSSLFKSFIRSSPENVPGLPVDSHAFWEMDVVVEVDLDLGPVL